MSLIKKIGNVAKMTAFGFGLYALSAFSGMTTDANASVNSQISSSNQTSIVYEVKSGDILSRIVAKYNEQGYQISVEDLAKINGIENSDLIQVGQKLKIPGNDDNKIDYVPTRVSLDSTKDLKQSVEKKDTLNQNLSQYNQKDNLESLVNSYSQKIENFDPTTALTDDVQKNRKLLSQLSGEQYHLLRQYVNGKDLDAKLGIKRGVHTIKEEQELENYASMYSIVKQVSDITGVSVVRIFAHKDKESNGDIWTSSGTGPRGALQLSEFMCRKNNNFKYNLAINPFNPMESTIRAAEYIKLLDSKFGDEIEILAYHQGAGKVNRAVKFAKDNYKVNSPNLEQVLSYPGGKYINSKGNEIIEGPFTNEAISYVPGIKKRLAEFESLLPQIIEIAQLKSIPQNVEIAENSSSVQENFDNFLNQGDLKEVQSYKLPTNRELVLNSTAYGQISPRLSRKIENKLYEKNSNFRNDLVARQEDEFALNIVSNNNGKKESDDDKPKKGKTYLAQNDCDIGCILANPPKYQGNPSQRLIDRLARREEERRKKLLA